MTLLRAIGAVFSPRITTAEAMIMVLRLYADLGVRMVAVTLIHRKGYFSQHLDGHGNQSESPTQWSPEEKLELMKPVVTVNIEGREVKVRAWRYGRSLVMASSVSATANMRAPTGIAEPFSELG